MKAGNAVIANTFGAYPSWYTNQYLGYNYGASVYFFAGKILVNYYLSDSLYVYHPDGTLWKAFNACSAAVSLPPHFFDYNKSSDKDYLNEFSFSYAAYGALETNNTSPYLFRTVEHSYHYYNVDSTINDPLGKPWSVVVLDRDLNIKGEISIGPDQLDYIEYMPYGKGFWARSLQEDKYYYYEMQLEK